MATIHDLFEVTGIFQHTTYSTSAGNLLGVVDNVTSSALNDGEFDEGDNILIGGVSYNIDEIQEPSSSGRFTLGDGSDRSFDPGSESNLDVVFLTVSNGGDVRHFIIPNDSYGDMNVQSIRTGGIKDVAGSDAAVISTGNNDMNVVCFASGTMIGTPEGDIAIDELRIGDLVLTERNGAQKIRSILLRELDFDVAPDRLKPILFEQDSLGPGRPNCPLCVSPQHRMLVENEAGKAVLVPAKALTGRRGVRRMHGKRWVNYIHLVFDQHEIIRANGTLTESFFPGPVALRALSPGCREEIREIFESNLSDRSKPSEQFAAPVLGVQEAKRLAHTFSWR